MADGSGSVSVHIKKVAAQCLIDAGGDESRAEEILFLKILTDKDLVDSFLKPYVRKVSHDLIMDTRSARRSILASPGARGTRGLHALATSWYDWPLISGILLGDADRDALRDESNSYERIVKSNQNRSRFFNQLHRAMPDDGRKVRDALKVADIAAIAASCSLEQVAA